MSAAFMAVADPVSVAPAALVAAARIGKAADFTRLCAAPPNAPGTAADCAAARWATAALHADASSSPGGSRRSLKIADSEKPRLCRKRTWRAFSRSSAGGLPKRRRHSATIASLVVEVDRRRARRAAASPPTPLRLQRRADRALAVAAALLPDDAPARSARRTGSRARRARRARASTCAVVGARSPRSELLAQLGARVLAPREQRDRARLQRFRRPRVRPHRAWSRASPGRAAGTRPRVDAIRTHSPIRRGRRLAARAQRAGHRHADRGADLGLDLVAPSRDARAGTRACCPCPGRSSRRCRRTTRRTSR